MATFSTKNWNKGTPERWRNIGDALLVCIPLFTGFVTQSPLPESTQQWVIFIGNIVLVGGKFLTKLFGESESHE